MAEVPAGGLFVLTDSSLRSVRHLAAAARGVFLLWRLPPPTRSLLELALVEAATNVVRHAYRDLAPGPLGVVLWRDGTSVSVAVKDRGRPFDIASVPPLPDPDPDDPRTWPETGMGVAIIRAACDAVDYASRQGENTLTMRIRLDSSLPGSA